MNPALALLSVALFTWGIGEGMFFYFQPIYLAELGADPIQIGTILGGAGVAMTMVHIPAGYLADRIGRLPLMRAAWSGGLLATLVMAGTRSLPFFVAGLILYSFTSFVMSPLNSYVTAARGKWRVERALTLISATFSAGMILGPLLGGWLGDRFGLRSIYIASLGVFVISILFMFSLPPQPVNGADPESSRVNLLKNNRYLIFLGVVFVTMFAMYLPQPLTPNFLQEIRSLSLGQIGLLGSLGAFGNVVLNLTLGQINARLGFIIGQFLTGLFALLIWRGSGMGAYGLAYFLLGGYRAARSLANAQVSNLVREAQMGLAYGLTETISALSLILAPPLAGYLYINGPDSTYPFSLLLISLGIILSLIFSPRPSKLLENP
ncbi:MAG: hypothetical protein B5M51_04520 [Anaerolinea sp. 4484_236]|nr:MAG: hypothetical protein B5M51_04520 [Anaerolinea sp. 4484_236]